MDGTIFQPQSVFRARAEALAARESANIRAVVPDADVQHIGGTSIEGALTKGDVDLVVRVTAENFPAAVAALRSRYDVNQPENWTPAFASFKDDTSFELPFGAQLVVIGTAWDVFTTLRDRLRGDAAALAAYNEVKQTHAGTDASRYREAKAKFIETLLGID